MTNDYANTSPSSESIYSVDDSSFYSGGSFSNKNTVTPKKTSLDSSRYISANTVTIDRAFALLSGDNEYQKLQKEHNFFAQKKINEGLSPQDEKKYRMVLWNLDRIEDAQMGGSLDMLEKIVVQQEQLERQLTNLVSSWTIASKKHRRGY